MIWGGRAPKVVKIKIKIAGETRNPHALNARFQVPLHPLLPPLKITTHDQNRGAAEQPAHKLEGMETPRFDQALGKYLEQAGMLPLLSDEDAARLEAALSAIGERHAVFPQPPIGDASPGQCRQWLDRLLQVFDDFTFHGDIAAPSQAHFAIVTSWWVYANHQAKAIRCLADGGLGADAAPLARSMIEFALWAVALSQDTGPLLSTVLRKSDEEELYTLKLAVGGPLEMPTEVIDLVKSTPKVEGEGSPVKDFSKICRLLGVGDTILITWRMLSGAESSSRGYGLSLDEARAGWCPCHENDRAARHRSISRG